MIDKQQFREMVREVLKWLEPEIPYTKGAEELLLLTAAQESHLGTYFRQLKGPARGVFQMEPATEQDIWENYLEYKPELAERVEKLLYGFVPNISPLEYNLAYQIAMARIHYRRVPRSIPKSDDINGLAYYWKNHYNTLLGKGTVEEAIHNYRRIVG